MDVERERLRVSDAERQAAAESLGAAFRDGRLDILEYDDRIARAYGAVTYSDLDRLFTDLARPAVRTVYPPFRPGSYGYAPMPAPMPAAQSHRYPQPRGPIGEVRGTALQMLLFVITLGVWGYVYVFETHDEMKRHSGEGLGGPLALIISLFATIAAPFLLSHEVGGLYARDGQRRRVSALTGLWFFPGILVLVGPVVWFALTNTALNDYWRDRGAR
jgi:hypothetical protein